MVRSSGRSLSLRTLSVAFGLATALLGAAAAHADSVAYKFDDLTGTQLGNGPFTLGSVFTTNSAITVTSLGVFDDSQDGLGESHEVGLWDGVGNLLASTTVQSGTVDPLTAQFRYASIAPVTLASGETYTIGAVWNNNIDSLLGSGLGDPTGFSTDPAISFVDSQYVLGGLLADPNTSGGGTGYFGPNFQFTTANAVPELGTGASLAGLLCAGSLSLWARGRRKRS